ncbi:L,D-transpeptidase OS=Streptomyces tendae OX=1932 GN=F3L20_24315 PE=4 SV=1 [Streptomyces tendae]
MEVVNSDGETMEPFGNGFGDWNMDWDEVARGQRPDRQWEAPRHGERRG